MSHQLELSAITAVVNYCNNEIIPGDNNRKLASKYSHPLEWFKEYFDFISDSTLRNHLGEAYYQARFLYKIMQGLRLTTFKRSAVLKFQIQQYASVYEALLDYILEQYHADKLQQDLAFVEYKPEQALARGVSLTKSFSSDTMQLFICRKVSKAPPLKKRRIDDKTALAVKYGVFTKAIKERFDALYDLRNNIHILKAAQTNYKPAIGEARAAFELMGYICSSIKRHLASIPK